MFISVPYPHAKEEVAQWIGCLNENTFRWTRGYIGLAFSLAIYIVSSPFMVKGGQAGQPPGVF